MSERPIIISIFGTNQYYEPPQFIINNYLKTKKDILMNNYKDKKKSKNNKDQKHSINDTIIFSINDENFCTKINFIKNFEKNRTIINSDAYIIFIDLECVDALDKLKNIMDYIKICGKPEIIKSYVIGKYNTIEDKIKSLDIKTMENIFKRNKFEFNYFEFCTEPIENFNIFLSKIFKEINETKSQDFNVEDYDKNNDRSKCLLI
jgi:hypothetical protein